MKRIRKVLKYLGILVLSLVLIFAGFLGYMTMRDYRPKPVEEVKIQQETKEKFILKDTLSFYTWNVGYGGLGAEQDFFFDGGKMVRPSKDLNQKYVQGIISTLQSMDSVDFMMLQEVDKGSKRSHFQDQVKMIGEANPGYCYGFATNYNSLFVPQPVSNPYGKCYGGIMTLAKHVPSSAKRYALAPDATWPTGLFMLKRCYMEFRYHLRNGKDLVVINQHLSAYDDGTVKQRQMDTLRVKLLAESKKGNYVIVGGDWNTYPPGYQSNLRVKDNVIEKTADANYPEPGWKYAYDPSMGTNRKLYEPFKKGHTDEVIIDYFLLSPNIQVITTQGVDVKFENSDHQPVFIKIVLQ
jgi:endonuclease/exonuclease/phosphatase family metal-dependent hydrolase